MSNTLAAKLYLKCGHSGRDYAVATHGRGGPIIQTMGRRDLRCHSKEPPPATDYQAWFDATRTAGPRGQHGNSNLTGERLRRAVRMVRNGYSLTEAGAAVGCKDVRKWIKKMPPELAP